jgi:copper chaperone CopZ
MVSSSLKYLFFVIIMLVTITAAYAGANRYILYVDGLACPFCAYGIEKQLLKIDGVGKLETDVGKARIVIEMDGDQPLDTTDVEQAVKNAGFSFKRLEPAGGDS